VLGVDPEAPLGIAAAVAQADARLGGLGLVQATGRGVKHGKFVAQSHRQTGWLARSATALMLSPNAQLLRSFCLG
jgi:hypothetical protein